MERRARGESAATARRLTGAGLVAAVLVSAAVAAVLLRGAGAPKAVDFHDTALRSVPAGGAEGRRPEGRTPGAERWHPLQHELIAMGASERLSVLRLAIRDRALDCDDVTDVTALAGGMPVWRVACSGARAYIVAVDEFGRIDVEQQFYHEPTVVPPTGPASDRNRGTPPPDRFDRGPFERLR